MQMTANGAWKLRSKTKTVLLASGFGGILFVTTFVVLGLITPAYDSLHGTISALEFTSAADLQRLNFLLFGLLTITFAVALLRELQSGRGSVTIPVFQALAGVGLIGDAIFIHEPLHLVCDLIAFNASMAVLLLFAWRFHGDTRWPGWTRYCILTVILMMGFLSAFGIALRLGGPAGLFEKLATLTRAIWSVTLVRSLYRGRQLRYPLSSDRPGQPQVEPAV